MRYMSKLTHIDETGAARRSTGTLPRPASCLQSSGGRAGERAGASASAQMNPSAPPELLAPSEEPEQGP